MTQPRDSSNHSNNPPTGTPTGTRIDASGMALRDAQDDDALLARMDRGDANRRILARTEFLADFRRVEAASLKFRVRLGSPEGKRALHRYFYSFQANLYVVSSIGRLKLEPAAIEQIEDDMRSRLDQAARTLDRAIDDAEKLFKNHAIDTSATFDAVPLEVAVGVIDSLGRRYLELIQKLDQLMPLLQTLEIWEVMRQRDVDIRRSHLKRLVRGLAGAARSFAVGTRRRSSAMDALRAEQATRILAKRAAPGTSDSAIQTTAAFVVETLRTGGDDGHARVGEGEEAASTEVEAETIVVAADTEIEVQAGPAGCPEAPTVSAMQSVL